ncbi:MAG: YfhO family protein [Sphingobacteriales bacterium]|nr:YfhO family protein [Sphingobacteriales bacterium]
MNPVSYPLNTGFPSPLSRVQYKNYFLLLLVCLLAYWPLTFGIFSVKNDAIHYFLPYRYSISEAIRNGEWPFWSPYIYMGYPVSGDMQSGAWNPVVWIFSLIGRYDLTLFHYENLLYIFLAGAGMYKLTRRLTGHDTSSLLIAVSYMLSGFMLSGQLINWLASAAFIPFVIHYYTLLLKSGSYAAAIKTAGSLYLLFTAGYPSFLIVTVYILAGLFLIRIIEHSREKNFRLADWKPFLLSHLLLLFVVTVLSLPALLSYINLLPYYQRGNGISYNDSVINSYDWVHFRSLLFPSAISAADIRSGTDVSLRNVYIGLLPLLLLFRFPPVLNRRNILLLCLGVFALLFSLGDLTPLRKFCFDYLPLMNTFRHPAQLRLFLLLSILLLTAPGLKQLLQKAQPGTNPGFFKKELLILSAVILVVTVTTLVQNGFPDFNFFFSGARSGSFKTILEKIRLSDTLIFNGLVQLLFLAGFFLWLKKRSIRFFSFLWIGNGIILAQFVLPVSFVSSHSPKKLNAFIRQQPEGFPAERLTGSLAENSRDMYAHYDEFSLTGFYNKKPAICTSTNNPSFLWQMEELIKNRDVYDCVASNPVTYIVHHGTTLTNFKNYGTESSPSFYENKCGTGVTDSLFFNTVECPPPGTARVLEIHANKFLIETRDSCGGWLILSQNNHHFWKAAIDGKPAKIEKVNISFMRVDLPGGKHIVTFTYQPLPVIKAIWGMISMFVLLALAGLYQLTRKPGVPST